MNHSQIDNRPGSSPLHGLLIIVLIAAATAVPAFRIWPLLWVIPLFAYAGLVALLRPLRTTFRPWRFGCVSPFSVWATLVITLGSCAVLITFHRLTQPDVRDFGRFIPISALGGVFVAGILFSVVNAVCEELVFRGILFDAAASQWGVWAATILTALLFGYGHMQGYPPGPLGAVLAGVYGLCLGWLRASTDGFGLPILAHIAADATIYTIVARSGVLSD